MSEKNKDVKKEVFQIIKSTVKTVSKTVINNNKKQNENSWKVFVFFITQIINFILDYLSFIYRIITYGIKQVKNTPNDIKYTLKARKKAGTNNFKLGKIMLKENNILDAKFRFLLADFFAKKSPINKYYLSYIYYLEGNYNKSLKRLKECIHLRPNMKKAKDLFVLIQKDLKEVNLK